MATATPCPTSATPAGRTRSRNSMYGAGEALRTAPVVASILVLVRFTKPQLHPRKFKKRALLTASGEHAASFDITTS